MRKISIMIAILVSTFVQADSFRIINKPVDYGPKRVALTKSYIAKHYGIKAKDQTIRPGLIVLHWTGSKNALSTYNYFKSPILSGRKDIISAGSLNVGSHYLVARDGTIYKLMPDNWMARHVIGLNYSAIGIENAGGVGGREDLTDKQVRANIYLVKMLKRKYPNIEYLIGHYEYRKFENTPLWLERDRNYRTGKSDPGHKFMRQVRSGVKSLHLQGIPGGSSHLQSHKAKHSVANKSSAKHGSSLKETLLGF